MLQTYRPLRPAPPIALPSTSPAYNERGVLKSEVLYVRAGKTTGAGGKVTPDTANAKSQQAIQNITYNAKGQKQSLSFGNGTTTRYSYDDKTFRLIHLYTRRGSGFPNDCAGDPDAARPARPCGVQNLHYTYDPVGNITHIQDDAQQTIYFNNNVVEPSSGYQYAKRAEQSLAFELGITRPGIVRFGAWEEVREGLLAGERLSLDLRRLEAMYLDRNFRELEITKHVPLSQINPLALTQLRATGQCTFMIPEELYDLDFPGHYFRRIKSVSVTLPCVAGPYTSVSGTLTLQSNRMRAVSTATTYDFTGMNDPNFIHDLTPVQAIATSSAQNDAGLFEFNFRDERYLPFEGAGAISNWRFELPSEFRQFNYSTISDLILHMKYTARNGGQALQSLAHSHLRQVLSQQVKAAADEQRLARALGILHEYPVEWAKLAAAATGTEQKLVIDASRLPYFLSRESVSIVRVTVVVLPKPNLPVTGDWVSLRPPAAAWIPIDRDMTGLPFTRLMETAELVMDEFDFTQEAGGGAWLDWTPFDLTAADDHTKWSLALQRSAADINDMAIVVWLRVGT